MNKSKLNQVIEEIKELRGKEVLIDRKSTRLNSSH